MDRFIGNRSACIQFQNCGFSEFSLVRLIISNLLVILFGHNHTMPQAKTKGLINETIITYPESVLEKLRAYIGERIEFVFIIRFGKPVDI